MSKCGNDLNFTEIDPIPVKSVGRGPLERGEAGVKVGDDDLGLMTLKSGEKTFLSRERSSLLKVEVASQKAISPLRWIFRCSY